MMTQQQQHHHHQLHMATGDQLQPQASCQATSTSGLDWLPFGSDPNYYYNQLQTAANEHCSPNWMTQSLRFRPYYVWPDSTSPSSVSGNHRSHLDDLMTSSFSTAPPYVDYQSLIASTRHSASAISDSGFHERNDVIGGGATSSGDGEDVNSVSGVNWTPLSLPPFGVEVNRQVSTSAMTSVHAVIDTRCHVNDEFSVVTSSCQTLSTG
jgi:hypothetical protein